MAYSVGGTDARLADHHAHALDVAHEVEPLQRAQPVEAQLRVVDGRDLDALAVLQVDRRSMLVVAQDHGVACALGTFLARDVPDGQGLLDEQLAVGRGSCAPCRCRPARLRPSRR
jgi:hypothetical protein